MAARHYQQFLQTSLDDTIGGLPVERVSLESQSGVNVMLMQGQDRQHKVYDARHLGLDLSSLSARDLYFWVKVTVYINGMVPSDS
jgi:hypothetical protein